MFLILHLKELKHSGTGKLSFAAWTKQQTVQTFTVSISLEQRAGLQAVSKQKQNLNHSHTTFTQESSVRGTDFTIQHLSVGLIPRLTS